MFIVASGVETSLDQLAHALLAAMGSSSLERGPARPTAVPRPLADISLAREHLGFEAQVALEDGLKRLVDWWRKQPV
jgi:UDP-glucose 4-epimerase